MGSQTSIFGNEGLERFFRYINDYEKKFFCVSIVGAKSSLKKTFINSLFGCDFYL
jgi:predicted P-loop ATPase